MGARLCPGGGRIGADFGSGLCAVPRRQRSCGGKCLADLRNRYAALDAGARGAVDPLLGEGWLALLRG